MRQLCVVLMAMAILNGCKNSDPVATTSAETFTNPVPSEKGDTGATGPQGDVGPAGAQGVPGVQGQAAPVFRLKDLDGNLIPGLLVGQGQVYLESEDKTTTYACVDGSCGMQPIAAFYQSNNCTGSPFVMPTNINAVFVSNGQRFAVSADLGLYTQITFHSFSDGTQCTGGPFATSSGYIGVPYSGDLPMSPNGPYQVVKQ